MRHRWQIPSDAEIVFTAGRFVRKKGFEYLIDTLAQLAPSRPSLRLVLAGGGDLDGEFRDRISRLGIANRVGSGRESSPRMMWRRDWRRLTLSWCHP